MASIIENLQGCLLLLPDTEIKPNIQSIRRRIRDTFGEDVEVQQIEDTNDAAPKTKYPQYCEYIFKADIDFGRIYNNEIRKNNVIREFCKENVMSGLGESWLKVNVFNVSDMLTTNSPVLNSFAFGSVVHMNTFVEHYSSAWSKNDTVCAITKPEICFRHDICKLEISFNVTDRRAKCKTSNTCQDHMIHLGYNLIQKILIEVKEQPRAKAGSSILFLRLYFQMRGAPFLRVNAECADGELDDEDLDCFQDRVETNKRKNYRRIAEFGKENTSAFCSSDVIGKSRVLCLDLQGHQQHQENELWKTVLQLISCCSQEQIFFTSMEHKRGQDFTEPSVQCKFNCLYALKTVFSMSYSVSDEINVKNLNDLKKKFEGYASTNSDALEKSLYDLHLKHEKGELVCFSRALDSLFQQYEQYFKGADRKSLPENMLSLRRVLVTPTRIAFLPPIVHMKSYLLRSIDSDYALRLTIKDDNGSKLTFTLCGNRKSRTKFVKETIGGKLLNGVTIGRRDYRFLGASPSQQKEHGCIFYAKDSEGRTAESIRENLGDLKQIRNVAKYMARLGLGLAQAQYNFILPRDYVEGPVEDIKVYHATDSNSKYRGKEYVFSDGIGQMSTEIAQMCYSTMKLNDQDYKPCAIQIRYGGCKGMLLWNPELTGKKVVLRKSMWKYNSDNNSLEILRSSYPQKAFLNRQFVTILENMGIEKQVFFDLQSKHLNHIFGSMYDSRYAVKLLHQENVLRLPFETLYKCGIDLCFEPFFRPMIMSICTNSIGNLKNKARIELPFSEARTMFGVLDETGELECGQVFVRYTLDYVDGKPSKEPSVLEGPVLITKNPCIHPGDVRIFKAVRVESLMHVIDCVVFPQKGPRPHPDEMAGSDLDGDEYCVVWHKPLIFSKNHEAMDFTNNEEGIIKDNITVEDMIHFMCDYIRDNDVGLIANAHLAWADQGNIFSPTCMKLAKKYATALDYGKTGKSEHLKFKEKVQRYPDFMEKHREKETYLSTRVLGELYRNCKKIELVSNILSTEVPIEIDPNLVYCGWKKYENDAKSSLSKYIHFLSVPTLSFQLTNEGEIMSGAIKKLDKVFEGKNIEKNIKKVLESVIPHVTKKMSYEFYKEFLKNPEAKRITKGSKSEEKSVDMLQRYVSDIFKTVSFNREVQITPLLSEMLKKASAWYQVAYACKKDGSSLYLGLPWVVPKLLGILYAKKNVLRKPSLQTKIKSFLNKQDTNVEEFLKEKPSTDAVELSSQIMRKLVNYLGSYVNLNKNSLVQFDQFLLMEIVKVNNSDDLLSATTEQILYKYLVSFAEYIHVQFDDYRTYLMRKDLGILAIITLSMLSSSGKLWDLSIQTSSNSLQSLNFDFLTKEYREEVLFPLDIGGKRNNGKEETKRSDFGQIMLTYTSEVADFLKGYTRLSHNPHIDFKEKSEGQWLVVVSVYGRSFCIETLKELIVQPSFHRTVKQYVRHAC